MAKTMTKKKSANGVSLGTLAALVVLCVLIAIASPNFLTFNNIMSVFKQTAFNAFVSVGMLLCLITAGIELSVGANAIFCSFRKGPLQKRFMFARIRLVRMVCARTRPWPLRSSVRNAIPLLMA